MSRPVLDLSTWFDNEKRSDIRIKFSTCSAEAGQASTFVKKRKATEVIGTYFSNVQTLQYCMFYEADDLISYRRTLELSHASSMRMSWS